MRIIQAGIYEYDKRKERKTRACGECGCTVSGRKVYCGPCYDARLMRNIAANRHKYVRRKA